MSEQPDTVDYATPATDAPTLVPILLPLSTGFALLIIGLYALLQLIPLALVAYQPRTMMAGLLHLASSATAVAAVVGGGFILFQVIRKLRW